MELRGRSQMARSGVHTPPQQLQWCAMPRTLALGSWSRRPWSSTLRCGKTPPPYWASVTGLVLLVLVSRAANMNKLQGVKLATS